MALEYTTIDREELAQLMQLRRLEKDLTLRQVANELGVSIQTAHYVLNGVRLPSPPILEQLLALLEITADQIPRVAPDAAKPKGTHVFISYSHKDTEYLERLMVHLKPLQRQGALDVWVDTKLAAGDKWKKEIEKALREARVAVLLVSADFLASDFILENELPPLLQAAENKGTLVVPVILKPCRYTRDKNLREFQSINPPDEPLSLLDENERELVYDSVAQRIEVELAK